MFTTTKRRMLVDRDKELRLATTYCPIRCTVGFNHRSFVRNYLYVNWLYNIIIQKFIIITVSYKNFFFVYSYIYFKDVAITVKVLTRFSQLGGEIHLSPSVREVYQLSIDGWDNSCEGNYNVVMYYLFGRGAHLRLYERCIIYLSTEVKITVKELKRIEDRKDWPSQYDCKRTLTANLTANARATYKALTSPLRVGVFENVTKVFYIYKS